jgi:WD40 repeat protein
MKKIISISQTLFFAFIFFQAQQVNAQDYHITFAGIGAATTVSTVEVENLATGKTLTLNGGDILHLTSVVGISQHEKINSSSMRIYPNPMIANSILSLYHPEAGDAVISVYEMSGKVDAQIHFYLERGRQEIRLSGLKNGLYLIRISGNTFLYSGKILCTGKGDGNIKLEKVSTTAEPQDSKQF